MQNVEFDITVPPGQYVHRNLMLKIKKYNEALQLREKEYLTLGFNIFFT